MIIEFGRLKLKNPITIASGPLTDNYIKIKKAVEKGAGGVSLKLTFLKVPFKSEMRSYSLINNVIISPTNKRLDLAKGLELLKEVKDNLDVVVFANVGVIGAVIEDWVKLSVEFAKNGADAIELNFSCPNLETESSKKVKSGFAIGNDPEVSYKIVKSVAKEIEIPIVCKFVPSDVEVGIETAQACKEGGADSIHIVGSPIAGLPPVDAEGKPLIPLLSKVSPGSTNGTISKYSTFLYVAKIAKEVDIPIMASGGLDNWKDCIDVIMWGATAPSVCSSVMWHGFDVIEEMNKGINQFLEKNKFSSIKEIRGKSLKYLTTPDKVEIVEGWAVIDTEKCIMCGRCYKIGHCIAIEEREGEYKVNPEKCIGCGVCASVCPVGAISYEVEK